MGSHSPARIQSFLAQIDLSALQYRFMTSGTANNQVTTAGANAKTVGILLNKPEAAQFAEIALPGGGAKLKISETVARLKYLTSTSTGLGEVADASGEHVGAVAAENGVANDVIAVEVVAFEAASSDA